jgi:uncharacterized protein
MDAAFKALSSRVPLSAVEGRGFSFGGVASAGPLFIASDGIFERRLADWSSLEAAILQFLDERHKGTGDFLLLGTGSRPFFPSPHFRNEVDSRGLGLETMNTSAACRTYNILIAEGRRFSAILLPL